MRTNEKNTWLNPTAVENQTLYGILMMLLSTFTLALNFVAVKYLTQLGWTSSLVVCITRFLLLVAIIPWCITGGFKQNLATKRLPLHMLRAFFSTAGALTLYFAFAHIALVDGATICYLEQVILVLIGIIYFGEPITKSKSLAISMAFIGAVLVLHPEWWRGHIGLQYTSIYHLIALLSVLFYAANSLSVKILGKTESTKTQLFYNLLFSTFFSWPFAVAKFDYSSIIPQFITWVDLTTFVFNKQVLYLLLAVTAINFVRATSFINSVKFSDLSLVMPFYYTNVVFVGFLGYYFFNETVKIGSLIGYVFIITAAVLLAKSEIKIRT